MKTMKHNKFRQAFTFIEIMVVVVILAILAALIVPNLLNKASDAKVSAAKSDISSLSTALQNYHLDNDAFPTTDEGLAALRSAPASAPHWKGPYLQKDMSKDPWGNDYHYESPGPAGQDYLITSYGSDAKPGGDGYAADITSDQ
jgi:general secretion pathway protein G